MAPSTSTLNWKPKTEQKVSVSLSSNVRWSQDAPTFDVLKLSCPSVRWSHASPNSEADKSTQQEKNHAGCMPVYSTTKEDAAHISITKLVQKRIPFAQARIGPWNKPCYVFYDYRNAALRITCHSTTRSDQEAQTLAQFKAHNTGVYKYVDKVITCQKRKVTHQRQYISSAIYQLPVRVHEGYLAQQLILQDWCPDDDFDHL